MTVTETIEYNDQLFEVMGDYEEAVEASKDGLNPPSEAWFDAVTIVWICNDVENTSIHIDVTDIMTDSWNYIEDEVLKRINIDNED